MRELGAEEIAQLDRNIAAVDDVLDTLVKRHRATARRLAHDGLALMNTSHVIKTLDADHDELAMVVARAVQRLAVDRG